MEVEVVITDEQFRRLIKMSGSETIAVLSAKTGMSEKTARKYLKSRITPSSQKVQHDWRTREDGFKEIWPNIEEMMRINPGLEATTILSYLIGQNSEQYKEGQVRTLQRRIKRWRATEGPGKEIKFDQIHRPGELSESDFTVMNEVGITIRGEHFKHLIYHFVLTYSNWEHGKICFSESFESLSEGLQESLWNLGMRPKFHRTDQMSSAVRKVEDRRCFTDRYQSLLNHYGLEGQKIQVGCQR